MLPNCRRIQFSAGLEVLKMAAKARKQRSKISLFPKDHHEVKSARHKLPVFDPHDLRSLITEAKTNDTTDVDAAFFLAFRRRNDAQMKKLLRHLGVDPSSSDAWERGFFRLAFFHHGVGHLAWYPRRTNRNSATWTPAHDLALVREVIVLRQRGLSERRAVKKLAADPKKRKLFPYRRQGYRFSTGEDPRKREAALWARWQKLKAQARGTSIVDLLVGVSQDGLSSIERSLYELDMSSLLPENR
jgi:hypothetical protein